MFEDLLNFYDDFTKNERTQSLSRLAEEQNFEFRKREPFGEQATILKAFDIFQKKGAKRFLGIIDIPTSELIEGNIRFYDYVVTKDLETKTSSIVEIYSPQTFPGEFSIRPRTSLSKLLKSSSNLNAAFRKGFKVDSNFDLPTLTKEILLDFPKIRIEAKNEVFLFYRKNKQIPITDIFKIVGFAEDFIESFDNRDGEDFV